MASIIIPRKRTSIKRPDGVPHLNRSSPQARGLVGWFPFNDGLNRAVNYADNKGNGTGNPVTELTNTSVTAGIGRLGHNRDFGGSGDEFYYLANPATITTASFPVTYSAWVNTTAAATDQTICAQSRNDSDLVFSGLQIRNSSGNKAGIIHRNTTFYQGVGTTTLQTGVWYHIAGTILSATERYVYVNGIREGESTDSSPAFDAPTVRNFSIGEFRDTSPSDPFAGQMSDICVWDYAKTDAEIWQLYVDPWDLYGSPWLMVPVEFGAEAAAEAADSASVEVCLIVR